MALRLFFDNAGKAMEKVGREVEEDRVAPLDLDAFADLRASWGLFRDRQLETYRALATFDGRI